MKKAWVASAVTASALFAAGTAMAGWSRAQTIDATTGHDAWGPAIAVNADGNGVALFRQSSGGVSAPLYANRFSPRYGWTGPIAISDSLGGRDVKAVIDVRGNITAVFQASDGADWQLFANRYAHGWGGAALVGFGAVWSHAIAGNERGDAMVVFTQQLGGVYRVYARRFAEGIGWEGTELIDFAAQPADEVGVAMNGGGKACAVFTQGAPGSEKMYSNRYTPGAGWGGAALIDAVGADAAMTPDVAIDPDGGISAAWCKGSVAVYVNRWFDGAWRGPQKVDNGSGQHAKDPSIAADAQGNIVVAFSQKDALGGPYHIYANRRSGAAWSGASRVDSAAGQDAVTPDVALGPDGGGFVVFSQSCAAKFRVEATQYLAGTGWGQAVMIDSASGSKTENPHVAIDGEGNALAVFKETEGSTDRICANRYVVFTPTPTATPVPPIDLKVNKNAFGTSDQIAVTADVQAISTPFYPFIRIVMPDGSTLYYAVERGLTPAVTPYLDGGPFTLAGPLANYPIAEANFGGIAPGVYYLEGGAVDATKTTSAANLVYVGTVDREVLTVH